MVERQKGTNRERFVRLAETRVNRTVKDIQLISNLSNKNNYSYTQKDVDKIFRTLDKELKAAKARFQARATDKGSTFSLED